MAAQNYRFNQKAGALNEVAAPALAMKARRSSGPSDDYASAHQTGVLSLASMQQQLQRQNHLTAPAATQSDGRDPIQLRGMESMFYYIVEDGQRVLKTSKGGTVEIIVGPKRVWKGSNRFAPMIHYVAHPGEFLIVRFRDGRQEHHPGPMHFWFDPREHANVTKEDALQIADKEAVVVYAKQEGQVIRRLVYGPATFVPAPGEWLHSFSWHGSRGGEFGYEKIPNALVFEKLWFMPDQMYHDIPDVRTADDAVLTVRLMIFFELIDVEKMLVSTHDPIGDFVNAATSDVIDFIGKHDFDSFKKNTTKLNEISTYTQLAVRADQCGYRINKIVYRGYGVPESLQKMHDEAIESRTKLQLERATEKQAQDLEDFKLERHLVRSSQQRNEEQSKIQHEISANQQRNEASLVLDEQNKAFQRKQQQLDVEQQQALDKERDTQALAHLDGLRALGVELTKYLTQGRADKVIELRGSATPHLHLDSSEE
jgi:hypothetical protein